MPGEGAHSCACSPGFKGRRCELGECGAAPLACGATRPGLETPVTGGLHRGPLTAPRPPSARAGRLPGSEPPGHPLPR